MTSTDFKEKTVIVTGGTKGIGADISRHFLGLGAHVATCGRNTPDEVPHASGSDAFFSPCDVRDPAQIDEFVTQVEQQFGSIDLLINNAGGSPNADAATASPRFSEAIIALNLFAPLHMSQRCNATMQQQVNGGNIINISSVSATRPSPGTAAYGAAKAGLNSLTTSLAVEWAPKVRVNAIVCGLIYTEQAELHYGDEAGVQRVAQTIPLERLGTPHDIANMCAFVGSDAASYMSGSLLTLHGGGERPAFLDAAE